MTVLRGEREYHGRSCRTRLGGTHAHPTFSFCGGMAQRQLRLLCKQIYRGFESHYFHHFWAASLVVERPARTGETRVRFTACPPISMGR